MAELTFYFDRNLGKRFPEALDRIRPPFTVEYHHSKKNNFAQNMKDDEWLEVCGRNGWIAFSHDLTIFLLRRWRSSNTVGAFYMPGGSEPTWYKVCYLIRAYPKIIEAINMTKKPYVYRVHRQLCT